MYPQLRHIVQVARQSKLTVQLIPGAAGAHAGLDGPFMLLEFEEQPALVYVEYRCGAAFLEATEHVAATQTAFRRLRQHALPHEDSVDLIASIADELA